MPTVQAIAQKLFGNVIQSNIFSFEFQFESGGGPAILEFPFLLPPNSYNVSEGWLATEQRTITGGYIADYGNDFKKISFNSNVWFYYAGIPASGGEIPNGWAGRGNTVGEVTGQAEFLKLRYLLVRFRDYIRLSSGNFLETQPFTSEGYPEVDLFRIEIEKLIGQGKSVLSDNVKVIFHAYDYGDHFYVKLDDFAYSLSESDPHTVSIQVSMLAYKKAEVTVKNFIQLSKPNAAERMKNSIDQF